jgi:recombination protein RecT
MTAVRNRETGTDLATRVADRAQQTGAEVAAQQEKSPFGRIADFLDQMKPQMALALPRHLNADRLARIALTEVRRTPQLAQCTQESFAGALMTCAQLGLEPGVGGEAYLLPFKNNRMGGRFEVQLVIGYQGMAKLFWQSPMAKSLDAQAVYPEDEFEYQYGLEPKLIHKPSLNRAPTSQAYAFYAVASTTTGGSAFVVLSRADVEKFRARGKGNDKGPWVTDYDAMARKTCVRQLFKLLPKSSELALAVANDETVRTDYRSDLHAITPVTAAAIDPPRVNPATGEVLDVDEAQTGTGDEYSADEPSAEEVRAGLEAVWEADRRAAAAEAEAEAERGDG